MKKTFYVTTPIYYANNLPHLGSLYTTIVADCLRRYKQQRGFETFFLTGTDEHGINIQRIAEQSGKSPIEYTDYIVSRFKEVFGQFGLDTAHGGYDIFMRTTEPFHYKGVAELWRLVSAAKTPKGNSPIYKGFYEGWFCPSCAAYKTEDEYSRPEVEGEPPLCLEHLKPLDRVSEEGYFFRLSDYDEALLALYEDRPDFIQPEARRNEVRSFVASGLQDLSISRQKSSVNWAIPVPDDPSQSIYVWFDALTNYITAIGFGSDDPSRVANFNKFWPALHLVGKDILRFHAVYWPAFLMAGGLELPRKIFAHGMWLDPNGRRMSKTLGNTVDLAVLHRHFSNDAVRYFCLRDMVFGQDGKFGYENLIDRTNSDLADGLGNLSSRTLTMISRFSGGKVGEGTLPESKYLGAKRAGIDADALPVASMFEHARDQFIQSFDDFAFSKGLETAWAVIAKVDKMLTDAKPWKLAKEEEQKPIVDAVLYRAAESIRWLCVMLYPIMPWATREIWGQLGLTDDLKSIDPAELRWGGLKVGTQLGEVKPVFPKLDKVKLMTEIANETGSAGVHATEADAVAGSELGNETQGNAPVVGATEADAVPEPQSETNANVTSFIEIGDFAKVDMRVGEVLTAERIPKSDKLLRFTIDIGEAQPRQVLAGIAEYYAPESMVGKKVIVVANLKARKLRGFESQGMVVAASVGENGRPVVATFTEDVPNGARLK